MSRPTPNPDPTLPLADRYYRTLVEALPIGTYINTAVEPLRTVYANPELVRMLGYTEEDWSREDFFESIAHPYDLERVLERSAAARRAGTRLVDEYRVFHRDGGVVWVHDETVTVNDEAGRPLFRQGLLIDITDRKLTEAFAADRGQVLELIAAGAPLDDVLAVLRRIVAEHLGPGATLHVPDGDPPRIELEPGPTGLRNEQREVIAITEQAAGIAVDRARGEEERRAADLRYRTLVEELPIGAYINSFGPGLSPLYVSPQLEAMLGYDLDEWNAPGMLEALVHPDDVERVLAASRRTHQDGVPFAEDYRLRTKDGRWLWVHDVTHPVLGENGEQLYLQGFIQDIDDRKRLEEQLLHAQKLEAVGRLAGGVAHDFNNLLTAIAGYAELLLAQFEEGDPRRADAEQIARAAERGASLTAQLLAFSRRQLLEPRLLNLNDVLGSLARLLRRLLGASVELQLHLAPELEPVTGDSGQLQQVIVDLAMNARDAMPDGGTLTISTRVVEVEAGPELDAGRYVELVVSDTGHGIADDLIPHIFEPFFTTKEAGKGTGLGLASVYGIVRQSGGQVSVTSSPGAGSAFRILLPPAR